MIRRTAWLLGLALLPAVPAQDDPKPNPAKARLAALQQEQEQIYRDWRKKMEEAAAAAKADAAKGKSVPAMSMQPDFTELRGKYLAAAKEFTGDDAAKFLMVALQLGAKPDENAEVLDLLLQDHLASRELRRLGRMLPYLTQVVGAGPATAALAQLEQSKDPAMLGWVAFAKHQSTLRQESPEAKAWQDAKAAVQAALADVDDEALRTAFTTLVDGREKFANGKVAPDIEGVDLDDVPFKLSDYKGKVVFLDFWGDW